MTSSMVSSMVFCLLLLLVFPHMDKALGAQEEANNQSAEEIYHPSGLGRIIGRIKCPRKIPFCHDPDIPNVPIPPPPHMPVKGRVEPFGRFIRICKKDPKFCSAVCKKYPKVCRAALICKKDPKKCRPGHV
ncbi:PREDICTED: uncharacterized protein LOC104731100 [Camelina sativa]|uniref:Uncharacterized protein LOC104731100 n=1 Tax=Camelina sativa TaxID=90675 RepID=A0ABM0UZR8_CAMSA|nr:PREDICTED: uncharacterized protein LOC104731100 [Camelina sativa]